MRNYLRDLPIKFPSKKDYHILDYLNWWEVDRCLKTRTSLKLQVLKEIKEELDYEKQSRNT